MTFKLKRTAGQGVEFQITSGVTDGGYQWGLPARVYRRVARDTINALLAENCALRHNKMVVYSNQPRKQHRLAGTVLNILAPKGDD